MNLNWRLIERIVAAVVFVWALVLYLLTVAPTASFWDSGEFIAIANRLQVSHPPGSPFYMLIGRLFSMFVPVAYISLAVNMVSVVASALTILLTHLIIVRIGREWQNSESPTIHERITLIAGGAIGALTFAATDSFWFNAVEAEVYALSMFFTAIVVWLIMKWSEQARAEEQAIAGRGQHAFSLSANRYLVLIAYMFGLAIGVHLLNLLAIFFIALIFYFTEFSKDDVLNPKGFVQVAKDLFSDWKGITITGVVSVLVFGAIYPGIIKYIPRIIGFSGSPLVAIVGISLVAAIGLYMTHKKGMQVANIFLLCMTVVLIGYSSYTLIFIRSAANPPIDENDPETPEAMVSYLEREQYGQTPLLTGSTYDNATGQIDPDRTVFFPRRHSPTPHHMRMYAQFKSDMHFFWSYQVNEMYFRYFFWNFMGKESDLQGAQPIMGIAAVDKRFAPGSEDTYFQTPSEKSSRNRYFALPFLLGLFGAIYHFKRDWKRAFSVFVLFFVTGLGIILYLNQTPLQPRERDYSYVASFFAFSLWIGIGATGILQILLEALQDGKERATSMITSTLIGTGGLIFLAVPLWMTIENYDDHDRSGRYVAPEYAYNMLMSVEEDAILVTNGDNDTFPLWYLQEVEGQRQDVRVVNISLLNTSWYIKQLKNQASRDSEPLPISMSNEDIENMEIKPWRPQEVELPVDLSGMIENSEVPIALDDTSIIESPMKWMLEGRPYSDQFNLMYVADQALLDILHTNARQGWKRPFYFAVTVSSDGFLDLNNYFQLEGQAFRVVPIKHDEEQLGRVVPSITPNRLRQFKFTNLNNPDVYYDENIRRMVDNYRNIFVNTVQTLVREGQLEEAREIMNILTENIPFETIPGTPSSYIIVARAMQMIGDKQGAIEAYQKVEPLVLANLDRARTQSSFDTAARFIQMVQLGYIEASAFDEAASFSDKIAEVVGDDAYRKSAAEFAQDRARIFPPDTSGNSSTSTMETGQ